MTGYASIKKSCARPRRLTRIAGVGVAALALALSVQARVDAVGNACVSDGSCDAAPACDEWGVGGHDNCGNPCVRNGPSCCDPPGACSATMPTECGETNYGTTDDSCHYNCSESSDPCPSSWVPYGFAVPGDPTYGFGLDDNNKKDLIGLAAKGNIILGDYTSNAFNMNALPLLQPLDGAHTDGKTQPYVVDPTDVTLGYDSGNSALCNGYAPCFHGDYTQEDKNPDGSPGTKLDLTARKFYESSLSDAAFQVLVDPTWDPSQPQGYHAHIEAVLYTNHALAGYAPKYGTFFFGSIVSRDDALAFGGDYVTLLHDPRLSTQGGGSDIVLPLSFDRLQLRSWKECPTGSCAP